MDYKQKAQELFAKVYEADMAAYQKEIEQKEIERQQELEHSWEEEFFGRS